MAAPHPYPAFAQEAVSLVYASLPGQPQVDEWLGTLLRAHGLYLTPDATAEPVPPNRDQEYLEAAANIAPPPPLPAEWTGVLPPLPPIHTYSRTKADVRAGTWRGSENLASAKHEATWHASHQRKQFMESYVRLMSIMEEGEGEEGEEGGE